ncbi:MAG: helix-turn-helix domain-containing protein [Candidatus Pacebacteria bacterium]|nr:helix-turn-helix domain-containing protein [Candidatus Paceibacterota bacterium]
MKNYNNILQQVGLSSVESSVYLCLNLHGALSISDIEKNTSHHRPAIYTAISSLLEKGLLIEIIEGKRKKYSAAKASRLYHIMDTIEENLNTIIPDLSYNQAKNSSKLIVEHHEGKKGIAHAFLDVVETLNKGDHFYRYSSAKDQINVDSYVPKKYRTLRDNKNLSRDVITNRNSGNQKKLRTNRNIKFIDSEENQFKQNIVQFIYNNKVSFLDFNTDNAYIIENEEVAEFQKNIFQTLFDKL